jgi:hypothetical protein
MKKLESAFNWPVALLASMVVALFTLMGSVSLFNGNNFLVLATTILAGAFTYLLFMVAGALQTEDTATQKMIARLLTVLIVVAVAVAVKLAITSLWIWPYSRDRSVAENIATAATIIAAIFTLLLNTLQRDIYWLTKRQPGKLSEKEIRERNQVFEMSYKFGAVLTIITLYGYLTHVDSIVQLKKFDSMPGLPGHFMIPAYCLVTCLVALPLAVAAWRENSSQSK